MNVEYLLKLNYDKQEKLVKRLVKDFVEKILNGRYKKFVSDNFLIASLSIDFLDILRNHKETPTIDVGNLAYTSSVTFFERKLEYACKAGGSGHHVAQSFSAAIADGLIKETSL